MCKNGLVYVHQLFENKQYKSTQQVWQEYQMSPMRFNCLKAAIPRDLKEFFTAHQKSEFFPPAPHNYTTFVATKTNVSQKVYKFLGDDATLIHNKFMKWRQELGCVYTDTLTDFSDKHTEIFKITNTSKYRSFQYRLLQRGLTTNVQLYKWGITPSVHTASKKEKVLHT